MNTISSNGGAVHAAQLQQQVGIAVLGKANEAANQQAQAALSLIDSAAETAGEAQKIHSDGHKLDVVA